MLEKVLAGLLALSNFKNGLRCLGQFESLIPLSPLPTDRVRCFINKIIFILHTREMADNPEELDMHNISFLLEYTFHFSSKMSKWRLKV
jgi:hypothetical protein